MPFVYAKMQKISKPSYRIFGYLTNAEKQEQVLCHGGTMENETEWKELEQFEREHQKSNSPNSEAREIMLTLPNNMKEKGTQEIENFINDYCKELGLENHPYYYAVHTKHKGKEQDNLHCHIVFSERQFNNNLEQQQKFYKKDIFQDPQTHKLISKQKAQELGIEPTHRKGELIIDKNTNQAKINNDKFTNKDIKFKEKNFLVEKNEKAKIVFEKYGYKFMNNMQKDFPKIFIKQYHISPYLEKKNFAKYNEIKNFNKQVKKYNSIAAKVWNKNKSMRPMLKQERKNILNAIKNLKVLPKITNLINSACIKLGNLIKGAIENQINQSIGQPATSPSINFSSSTQKALSSFQAKINQVLEHNDNVMEQREQEQEQDNNFEREIN